MTGVTYLNTGILWTQAIALAVAMFGENGEINGFVANFKKMPPRVLVTPESVLAKVRKDHATGSNHFPGARYFDHDADKAWIGTQESE
jgi:hypothetical protein